MKTNYRRKNPVKKNMEIFHKPKTYRNRKRDMQDKQSKQEVKYYEEDYNASHVVHRSSTGNYMAKHS